MKRNESILRISFYSLIRVFIRDYYFAFEQATGLQYSRPLTNMSLKNKTEICHTVLSSICPLIGGGPGTFI